MLKRIVSGMIFAMLLLDMFVLAFDIQRAGATGTIYVRADGSVDPSDALISSVDNVTYTFADDINDSIVVERRNITIDGAGYTLSARALNSRD